MTDWNRVRQLREKGSSWSEIASDSKVSFVAPTGADAGRALKTLYLQRMAKKGTPRGKTRDAAPVPREPLRSAWAPGSRRFQVLVVAAVVVAGLGGFVAYVTIAAPQPPISPVVTTCSSDPAVVVHYHVLVIIDVNGAQTHLPYDPTQTADIGYLDSPGFTNAAYYCTGGEIHVLHTHDGSGIVHIELPASITTTPTLGEFFQIWGEPLGPTAVWSYTGHATASVLEMWTGQSVAYTSGFSSIQLLPSPGSNSNAYTIPSNLIFNGQYGSGASNNVFGGEIIWLNITTGTTMVKPALVFTPAIPLSPAGGFLPAARGIVPGLD